MKRRERTNKVAKRSRLHHQEKGTVIFTSAKALSNVAINKMEKLLCGVGITLHNQDWVTTDRHSPTLLHIPAGIPFALVVCGYQHTVALNTNQSCNVPTPFSLNGDTLASIHCGFFHTIAITSNQECYIWGCSNYGQLGFGDTTNRNTPTLLKFP